MSNYPCESNHIVVTKKSKVPEYLQQGDFYKSLNDEGDEEISVPSNTLKPNTIVESTEDLQDLLSSLRFWAVDSVMEEVVEYCLIKNSTTCATVLEVFMNDFCYVKTIVQMLPLTEEDRAKLAIKLGLLEFVIVLHKSCCALPDGCHIAARAGHLHVLQYLHEHGGKIDTLIELICEGSEWPPSSLCVCSHAAAEGSIECLRYVREQGCCEWRDNSSLPLIPAIWKGQTSCVEYALQHGYPISQEYDIYCYVAARMGFIYILKLLHAAGSPFNEHTCSEAAYNGHLDCVQYLHENGCPWYKCICEEAARGGSVDCLRYAHENGCEWDALTCTEAAKNGKLQCLQYAHEHGCDWNVSTCTEAARYGHLECLQYAHEHGCEWNAKTCNEAARQRALKR